MGKLTVRSGAIDIVKDISGVNLLYAISMIMPKHKLPEGFTYDDVSLCVGGQIVDLRVYDINRVFTEDATLSINPKGLGVGTIIGIVSILISAASVLLTPDLPTTRGATKDSPNNGVFGQVNTIRLDEQEPNPYGNGIVYPDLLVNEGGAWGYVDNQKIINDLFLIGAGSYEKQPPKFELTPFDSIPGQSYTYYEPFDLIPVVQGQFNSEFIDGQSLLGPNNDGSQLGVVAVAFPVVGEVDIISNELIFTATKNPDWSELFSLFQIGQVTVRYTYTRGIVILAVCEEEEVTRDGVILSMIDNGPSYTIKLDATGAPIQECNSAAGLTSTGYGTLVECKEVLGEKLVVTMPVKTDELQFSVEFRSGLRGDVQISVFVEESGGQERYNFTYSANTSSQLFFTEKIAIAPPSGDLEVAFSRLNDDKEDNSDNIQVSQVATNSYRYNAEYGNRTVLATERKATPQALNIKDSKINAEVTRKTISYDLNTSSIINTLTASRSFADALLHEYVEVQGLSPNDLPLDELYAIDESIPTGLNFYDYTFSDKEQSIKERLDIIANVARCIISFDGDGYNIFRNEQRLPVAQFDSRNIAIDSPEETSYRGAVRTSNDGVKLRWRNPIGNKFEFVYYVVQGANTAKCIHQGGGLYTPALPTIPYEIELYGCSTLEQAEDRADLEARQLIYIQKTVKIKTLVDGENVSRGQVVKYADYYQEDITSGEIAAINGNVYTSFSELIVLPGNYYVSYTDSIGAMNGPISCTVIDEFTFTAVLPDAYIADGYLIQSGSRFVISTLEEHENSLYVVSNKVSESDGNVSLELSQYSEKVYPELD